MEFETINLIEDIETVIKFRKKSFEVSFGTALNFYEREYSEWVSSKIEQFPKCFVLIKENH